jgi:hypothetical protein
VALENLPENMAGLAQFIASGAAMRFDFPNSRIPIIPPPPPPPNPRLALELSNIRSIGLK